MWNSQNVTPQCATYHSHHKVLCALGPIWGAMNHLTGFSNFARARLLTGIWRGKIQKGLRRPEIFTADLFLDFQCTIGYASDAESVLTSICAAAFANQALMKSDSIEVEVLYFCDWS